MRAWLSQKSVTNLEFLILLVIGCLLSLGFLAFMDHKNGGRSLDNLSRTAGEREKTVRALMGDPLHIYSLDEYNKRCPIPNDAWEPDPQPQTDIDEIWYYEISPVRIAYLYLKKGVVVRIYHGAT